MISICVVHASVPERHTHVKVLMSHVSRECEYYKISERRIENMPCHQIEPCLSQVKSTQKQSRALFRCYSFEFTHLLVLLLHFSCESDSLLTMMMMTMLRKVKTERKYKCMNTHTYIVTVKVVQMKQSKG